MAGFAPRKKTVRRTVVWVRLPGLPMEFWELELLMEIASEAGKPVALDNFTSRYRKTGFAELRVELESSKPLKPRVSICSHDGVLW